jgi:mono/diheme cytochrome c family protein
LKTEFIRPLLAVSVLVGLAGCADMKDQARHEPLEGSAFFADGRSSRTLVEGTVPRGHLDEDDAFYRGVGADGKFIARIPTPVDATLLARGKNRYEIYCTPCHSKLGDGMGMVVQRGYKQAASYHTDRLRAVEDGYIYDVITNGFAQMQGYAAQVRPQDRWAIVAYIRALQLSQMADVDDLDPEARRALDRDGDHDPNATGSGAGNQGDEHGSAH